uniref:Uncharacterized protein n=1 Tax=Physcomitrium patens TaxID=3218 RepID=A0A2K1JE21_PHYPA|nr:hypothetical protein PHYPA_020044 [Physcomitrium patens]
MSGGNVVIYSIAALEQILCQYVGVRRDQRKLLLFLGLELCVARFVILAFLFCPS